MIQATQRSGSGERIKDGCRQQRRRSWQTINPQEQTVVNLQKQRASVQPTSTANQECRRELPTEDTGNSSRRQSMEDRYGLSNMAWTKSQARQIQKGVIRRSRNQTSRVKDLANLPAGFSRKPSNLHTVRSTPWTRVGTVRSSEGIALTRSSGELDSQAGSVQISTIYASEVKREKLSRSWLRKTYGRLLEAY